MKSTIAAVALTLTLMAPVFAAQPESKATISQEQATKIALEKVPGGHVESAEIEKEGGKLVWSFDIKSGNEIKEVYLDAHTGTVVKVKTESLAEQQNEKAMDQAEKAALDKVPGQIVKKELEKEKGNAVYEFHIKTKDGKIKEVKVDAKTQKVTENEEVGEMEGKEGKEGKENNEN